MPPSWALPVVAFVSTFAVGSVFGFDARGTRHALEATVRLAYLWFLVAYAGGALATLMGTRFRYGREFGIAFAAAHSVHLILVLWLYWLLPTAPTAVFGINGAIFGSVGFALMYVMVICSVRSIALKVSPWFWRLLRLIALEYIQFAFLSDFWKDSLVQPPTKLLLWYMPFITLGFFGTSVRVLRWRRQLVVSR